MKRRRVDEEPPATGGDAIDLVAVRSTDDPEQADRELPDPADAVDAQSEQSFPASDPPSWPASSI